MTMIYGGPLLLSALNDASSTYDATITWWVDRWIGRWAAPDSAALQAVSHLRPCIVVTGGSRGIGLAIGRVFHAAGATVMLVARNEAELAAALTEFADVDLVPVVSLALDVTKFDAAELIDAALTSQGLYLDVLVNAAGVGLAGPFVSHDGEAISDVIALNVTAVTRLMRFALSRMLARGRGGILNIASLGGYIPGPNQAAYYASKAFVCSLTEAVAAEVAGAGVRVTVVAPGPVATGFHAAMGADQSLYRVILPALTPDQVAKAAVSGYRLGHRVVVPGIFPKFLSVAAWLLPHWMTQPVVRLLLATQATKPPIVTIRDK